MTPKLDNKTQIQFLFSINSMIDIKIDIKLDINLGDWEQKTPLSMTWTLVTLVRLNERLIRKSNAQVACAFMYNCIKKNDDEYGDNPTGSRHSFGYFRFLYNDSNYLTLLKKYKLYSIIYLNHSKSIYILDFDRVHLGVSKKNDIMSIFLEFRQIHLRNRFSLSEFEKNGPNGLPTAYFLPIA